MQRIPTSTLGGRGWEGHWEIQWKNISGNVEIPLNSISDIRFSEICQIPLNPRSCGWTSEVGRILGAEDSILGFTDNKEFVVYDPAQVYPEYIM
jgi:hypothetical protein